ncbi:MAG TPA: type II toxin-antitoxin system VapC family toxin [Stellaceae bacterium]|nr:type II toxin-antitoxin system VapC family toxin [Stellaceae bacterium]
MRILLDTHVFLWWLDRPRGLSADAQEALAAPENIILVSVASAWELAIKGAIGHLKFPVNVEATIDRCGFQKLGISFAHAARAGNLPRHHRDPFDRMLIAQAQSEGLTLVTRDRAFSDYGISLLQA